MRTFHNEQDFVAAHAEDLSLWPSGRVISFKRHLVRRFCRDLFVQPPHPAAGPSILAFHGDPRPENLLKAGIWSRFPHLCRGPVRWMQHVNLVGIDDLGGDIVPELIKANQRVQSRPGVSFQVVDLIKGPVPKADVVLVRDCLVHLSYEHIAAALANIAQSGSTWLLTTTFPDTPANEDIATGEWRAIDLTKAPFALPHPERLVEEGQAHLKGQRSDKMLGLWRISDLPQAKVRAALT